MPTIHESIEIDRPCDEVFAFATDVDNVTLYQSNMVDYTQETPGPRDKAARDRGMVRVAGKKMEFTSEVTEWEPPRRAVLRSLESPMTWEMEMDFEAIAADRTRLTIHQEVGEVGGFFGKLGDTLVTRMYTRDVRSNLENLKELLEQS